jgi:hypothetical protein
LSSDLENFFAFKRAMGETAEDQAMQVLFDMTHQAILKIEQRD